MKFDECTLNRQSFPYENFALRKSQYCIFYVRLFTNLIKPNSIRQSFARQTF